MNMKLFTFRACAVDVTVSIVPRYVYQDPRMRDGIVHTYTDDLVSREGYGRGACKFRLAVILRNVEDNTMNCQSVENS